MIKSDIMKLNVLKLKRILDEKEMDQSALAKTVGVTRQQISKWLLNPEALTLKTIDRIATGVDTDPKELIGY